MTSAPPVMLAQEGAVAVLTLNRPAVLNAIDDALCDLLCTYLEAIERDGTASVLVVHGGSGRAFSAGADLGFMRGLAGPGLRRFIEKTWLVFDRIARAPLISIAAIHGYALGGGAELALACDFRVVEETAVVGFPEMTLGSVPGSGALQRLPSLIGPARALDMVTSGERVDGRRALDLGLADRLAPPSEAQSLAMAWAQDLAQRPPEAIRYAKACIRLGAGSQVAPLMHGLVSSACQSAKDYRANTERFSSAPAGVAS